MLCLKINYSIDVLGRIEVDTKVNLKCRRWVRHKIQDNLLLEIDFQWHCEWKLTLLFRT